MNKYLYILITVLILTSWFGNTAFGAIGFDATSTFKSTSATTSVSWSHTVTSTGTNTILIVNISHWKGNPTSTNPVSVSSVTYNGQALTKAQGAYEAYLINQSEQWYLLNPPTGTNIVSVTNATTTRMAGGAVSLTGVKQSEQPESISSVTSTINNSTSTSKSITTINDGAWIIDNLSMYRPTSTQGASQTKMWDIDDTGNTGSHASYRILNTAGNATNTWSFVSASYALTILSLSPAQDAPTSTPAIISTSQTAGSMSITSGSYTIQ